MKIETCQITALAYGGAGIGRLPDGRVCFVPLTLPGELVEVSLVEEKKRFVRGRLNKILSSSDSRIDCECPHFGSCPGCVYRHCTYQSEIYWKDRQLRDFLHRSGLVAEDAFQEPFAAPETDFYRNKLTLHRSETGAYGYYALDNETILPVAGCRLAKKELNELIPSASGENALLRFTDINGARQISKEAPGILQEDLPGVGIFEVSGSGFFQTNLSVAAELVRQVKKFALGSGEILELYCGVGVFSIALAKDDPSLHCTGIELNKRAVDFAISNAQRHNVADRCRFFAGDAGRTPAKFRRKKNFTLLLDPPRSGMEKDTLKKVVALGAEKVIYISCAADTLGRDLKEFVATGYRVTTSQVLDMFPRTAHFEVLTVLEKHD